MFWLSSQLLGVLLVLAGIALALVVLSAACAAILLPFAAVIGWLERLPRPRWLRDGPVLTCFAALFFALPIVGVLWGLVRIALGYPK